MGWYAMGFGMSGLIIASVLPTGRCSGIEGFWSYAKERLLKEHGLSALWFPLRLKEGGFV